MMHQRAIKLLLVINCYLVIFSCERVNQNHSPNDYSSALMVGYLSPKQQQKPYSGNTYIFRIKNEVIHFFDTDIYSAHIKCCYRKVGNPIIKSNLGYIESHNIPPCKEEISRAYRDSQVIHKDTFLRVCENTEGINEALVKACAMASDYSLKEISEIIKHWDFAVYGAKNYKTEPHNQINMGDTLKYPLLGLGGNKILLSSFDTSFYAYPIQSNQFIIGVFVKNTLECVQTFLYTIYQRDKFIQVHKKILDGESIFINEYLGRGFLHY